jgi:hypothetical protein
MAATPGSDRSGGSTDQSSGAIRICSDHCSTVHQHHGSRPYYLDTVFDYLDTVFAAPLWRRRKHRRFQLGLNHLYVFEHMAD